MDPSEPASRWEQPPAWNGKAETWDDGEREMALWTDSFNTRRQHLGPRQVISLSHLRQVYEVGLSVQRVELVKNTGVETLVPALRHSGLVRKVPTDISAKLQELVGLSMRRKAGSEGFAACGIRFNKYFLGVGSCTEALGQNTGCLQALSSRDQANPSVQKQRIERIRGERGLGHSIEATNTVVS